MGLVNGAGGSLSGMANEQDIVAQFLGGGELMHAGRLDRQYRSDLFFRMYLIEYVAGRDFLDLAR